MLQPNRKFRVYLKEPGEKWKFLAMFVWKWDAIKYAEGKSDELSKIKVMHGKNIVFKCMTHKV